MSSEAMHWLRATVPTKLQRNTSTAAKMDPTCALYWNNVALALLRWVGGATRHMVAALIGIGSRSNWLMSSWKIDSKAPKGQECDQCTYAMMSACSREGVVNLTQNIILDWFFRDRTNVIEVKGVTASQKVNPTPTGLSQRRRRHSFQFMSRDS